MRDNVTVLYRGARYELGRGPGFYGIWLTGTPQDQPFEWWHETPEGWYGAWARLTAIETPGTIAPVSQAGSSGPPAPQFAGQPGSPAAPGSPAVAARRRSAPAIAAAALLGLGALLSLIGLFPGYIGGSSLASVGADLVPHVIYLAAWTAAGALILVGGWGQRAGALLAAGVSVVTLGLFLADFATVMHGGSHLLGGGLVLSFLGWLAATAGGVVALWLPPVSWPSRPRGPGQLLTVGLAAVLGIGAAIAFAPSWDSFTVRQANGNLHHYTAGNAFANPGPVIASDLIVMILFVAVVVIAALWRPGREGAVLLAAAIVPFLAQAISAFVQLGQAASLQFGLTPAEATREGLTITAGLTPAFWIYCVLVVALMGLCAWMFVPRRPVAPSAAAPAPMASVS